MSLKAFHLVFISMATMLALAYAVWAFSTFQTTNNTTHIASGIGAVLVACGLVAYGATTIRKIRKGSL